MRRQAVAVFGLMLGAGIGGLVAVGLVSERTQAFTLGVGADGPVVKLRARDEVCQRPVEVLATFDAVQLQLGTYGRPATPYSLRVRSVPGGRPLAVAAVRGGYQDSVIQTVRLPRDVPAGRTVAVCIRNAAAVPVAVYGSSDLSNRTSTSYLNGRGTGADLMLLFDFPKPKTHLELLPSMIRRASLFHGGWASPAAYWFLFALVLVALATLPALALRAALGRAHEGE